MKKPTSKKAAFVKSVKPILYFAYGANTNLGSMERRCPAARPLCALRLKDYKLMFRGVADVVPAKGAEVFGALWRITPACERALDRFEGFPRLYTKSYASAVIGGVEVDVMFYVMNGSTDHVPPSHYYEATLREGYADFDLPAAQLDDAIAEATLAELAALEVERLERKEAYRRAAAGDDSGDEWNPAEDYQSDFWRTA